MESQDEDDDVKALSTDIFETLQTYLQNDNVEVEIRFCTFYVSGTRKVGNYECNKKWEMYRFVNNERHRIDVGVSKKDFEIIRDKLTLPVCESEQIAIRNKDDNSSNNNNNNSGSSIISSNKLMSHMKTLEVHENGLRYVFVRPNKINCNEDIKCTKTISNPATNNDISNTDNKKYDDDDVDDVKDVNCVNTCHGKLSSVGNTTTTLNSNNSVVEKEVSEKLSNKGETVENKECSQNEKSRKRYEEEECEKQEEEHEWQLLSIDKKKKLCVNDICICNKKYDIRLAVSSETPIYRKRENNNDCNSISKLDNSNNDIIKEASTSELKEQTAEFAKVTKINDLSARSYRRIKERWTFCRGNANVDLTIVSVKNKQCYEIEVEWNARSVKVSEITKEQLCEFIADAIDLIDDIRLVGNNSDKLSSLSLASTTSVAASPIHTNSTTSFSNNSYSYLKRSRWSNERYLHNGKTTTTSTTYETR